MTGLTDLRAALELALECLDNVEMTLGIQLPKNYRKQSPKRRGKCPNCGTIFSISQTGKHYCSHCLSERMKAIRYAEKISRGGGENNG